MPPRNTPDTPSPAEDEKAPEQPRRYRKIGPEDEERGQQTDEKNRQDD